MPSGNCRTGIATGRKQDSLACISCMRRSRQTLKRCKPKNQKMSADAWVDSWQCVKIAFIRASCREPFGITRLQGQRRRLENPNSTVNRKKRQKIEALQNSRNSEMHAQERATSRASPAACSWSSPPKQRCSAVAMTRFQKMYEGITHSGVKNEFLQSIVLKKNANGKLPKSPAKESILKCQRYLRD